MEDGDNTPHAELIKMADHKNKGCLGEFQPMFLWFSQQNGYVFLKKTQPKDKTDTLTPDFLFFFFFLLCIRHLKGARLSSLYDTSVLFSVPFVFF